MSVINLTSNEKYPSVDSQKVVEIKRCGGYEYIPTKYEGIKEIVNSSIKGYLVSLDYGKKEVYDADKKCWIKKQNKSVKRVDTISEAKALRIQAEEIRRGQSVKVVNRKMTLGDAITDYMNTPYFENLSPTYRQSQRNIFKHVTDYFNITGNNKLPSKITIQDIERYFEWQKEQGNRNPVKNGSKEEKQGVSINTLHKHKTVLKLLFNYMIDNKEYGISQNVVEKASVPKVKIVVDGKEQVMSSIPYFADVLSLEQVIYTLNDAIQNEYDRSIALFIAFAVMGSLRRGEILGLEIGKFYRGKYMSISDKIFQKSISCYKKDAYLKNTNVMMIDTAINYVDGKSIKKFPKRNIVRVSAIPNELRNIVDYCMEQREQICKVLGVKIKGTDRMYYPIVNLIKGSMPLTAKIDDKWNDYQIRRNERMQEQGLEPIPLIRLHDLRHTHRHLLKQTVSDWQVSVNMGHQIGGNTTNRNYWHDEEMYRDDILRYFNENIKLDWDKAMRKNISDSTKIWLDSSGHLHVVEGEKIIVGKNRKKARYNEQEILTLFSGQSLKKKA